MVALSRSVKRLSTAFVVTVVTALALNLPSTADESTQERTASSSYKALTLYDFGAKCDGVKDEKDHVWHGTDDTVAIQKALDSGHNFIIPDVGLNGCLFSSTLKINLVAHGFGGLGSYSGRLVYTATSSNPTPSRMSDLLTVSQLDMPVLDGAPGYGHSMIHDLTIVSGVKMLGGAAIHQFNQGFIDYRNVSVGSEDPANLFHGLWFDQTDFTTVIGFFAQASQDALRVSGNGRLKTPDGREGRFTGPQYDLYVSNGKIGGSKVGIHIGGGFDNAVFDLIMDTSNETNVLIDESISGRPNQHISFGSLFSSEYADTDGLRIDDTQCDPSIFCVLTIGGHWSANKRNGINVVSMPHGQIVVKAQEIEKNEVAGLSIQDTTCRLSMDQSTQIWNNGMGVVAKSDFMALSLGQVYQNKSGDLSNVRTPNLSRGPIIDINWMRVTPENGSTLSIPLYASVVSILSKRLTHLNLSIPAGLHDGQTIKISNANRVDHLSWLGEALENAPSRLSALSEIVLMWDQRGRRWIQV